MTGENQVQQAVKRPSVLFVCHGNTCRSFMAEVLARRKFGDRVHSASAGIYPGEVSQTENAIDTLQTYFDINVSGHVPRSLGSVNLDGFDYVVALDKKVAKNLRGVPKEKLIVWNIPDPFRGDLLEYKQCALRINHEVSKLSLY
jgi:ArsR family transcriptional regulator, arsenate/arsenite/antimonite-responsive transcriptional repressor / arsenate reductase (thioredoxin)